MRRQRLVKGERQFFDTRTHEGYEAQVKVTLVKQ